MDLDEWYWKKWWLEEAEVAWEAALKGMVPVEKLVALMEHWRNLPIVAQAVGAEELVEKLCGELEDLIIKEHSA